MKKEIFIIFVIIIGIIVADIVTQKYTNRFFESISDELTEMENIMISKNIDNEDLKNRIENIQKEWKSKYKVFACFIEHDELEKVQTQLISINANIKVEDYDKSIDEIEKCIFILKHIEEKDSLKLQNIF